LIICGLLFRAILYTVLEKWVPVLFLSNSVTRWQILIIFGTQHHEQTRLKMSTNVPTSP